MTAAGQDAFAALLREVTADAGRFGHREHVRLTWLAVRRHGAEAALGLVDAGIRSAARAAGTPEKYHATMTRAWVELVAHHAARDGTQDGCDDTTAFAGFTARHPALLDKGLLTRFYRPGTLAGAAARRGWVEPDLRPFPWT